MTDWGALGTSGAFVLGVILGGLAMGRVHRNVMNYLRAQRRKDD